VLNIKPVEERDQFPCAVDVTRFSQWT